MIKLLSIATIITGGVFAIAKLATDPSLCSHLFNAGDDRDCMFVLRGGGGGGGGGRGRGWWL